MAVFILLSLFLFSVIIIPTLGQALGLAIFYIKWFLNVVLRIGTTPKTNKNLLKIFVGQNV